MSIDPLSDLGNVKLVIDCGANVRYSTAYFLSPFHECEVIAVEPDAGHFAVLASNVEPYGCPVRIIRGGVWSSCCNLRTSDAVYGDGRDWTRQVEEYPVGADVAFTGFDIPSLLAMSDNERISLLKVDIEGAEAVVFGSTNLQWREKVDSIAIELHDDADFGNASKVFLSAINGRGFDISRSGELTLCRK